MENSNSSKSTSSKNITFRELLDNYKTSRSKSSALDDDDDDDDDSTEGRLDSNDAIRKAISSNPTSEYFLLHHDLYHHSSSTLVLTSIIYFYILPVQFHLEKIRLRKEKAKEIKMRNKQKRKRVTFAADTKAAVPSNIPLSMMSMGRKNLNAAMKLTQGLNNSSRPRSPPAHAPTPAHEINSPLSDESQSIPKKIKWTFPCAFDHPVAVPRSSIHQKKIPVHTVSPLPFNMKRNLPKPPRIKPSSKYASLFVIDTMSLYSLVLTLIIPLLSPVLATSSQQISKFNDYHVIPHHRNDGKRKMSAKEERRFRRRIANWKIHHPPDDPEFMKRVWSKVHQG